ncbi:MAG: hypothetical protein Q9207_000951 [Kuettlingeria erythrocarpa]
MEEPSLPEGVVQVIKEEEALVDYKMTAVDDTSSEAASDSTDNGTAERAGQLPNPAVKLNKLGKPLGEPTVPGERYSRYDTAHYHAYDAAQHSQLVAHAPVARLPQGSLDYKIYDHYVLFTDAALTKHQIDTIPDTGVRLDDRTAALVLENISDAATLNRSWPAEFDTRGMPRATRVPLGLAAKMWVTAGDVDVDGNVATEDDEGWYYKWWKGLQVLMGQEGNDAGLYLIRPTHEFDRCAGMGFKLSHWAVVQEAPPAEEEEEKDDELFV